MYRLKKPDLPKGNLYDRALKRPHDPKAQTVVRAVQGTFLKFGIPKDDWSAMGNILIRFGFVVAENGLFTTDKTDARLVTLKRLFVEMFSRLGNSRPFLKIHREE
jgi:hypothetical protein